MKIGTELKTMRRNIFGMLIKYNFKSVNQSNMCFLCRIPTIPEHRMKWLKAIEPHQPINQITSGFYICELHFESTDIIRRKNSFTCKSGAAPTIFPLEPPAKRKKMYVSQCLRYSLRFFRLSYFLIHSKY